MDETLRVLQRAVQNEHKVRIIYESDGNFSERTIKPERITEDKISGYCYMRKRKRTFVISKILAAAII